MLSGSATGSAELPRAPELESYYHGYISRQEAEQRLHQLSIPGSYLLRFSPVRNGEDKWDGIYVLSFLSSDAVCYHFKLIPRLNCFQLGGRLFDCLQGCLSRYYVRDIMTGERLKVPVPPPCTPVELFSQRMRAIQPYEADNANDRLCCSIGDRFLLVSEEADWVFVICLRTRHSGYLPKCCLEKEYPALIDRLDFFHPDPSTPAKDLLHKAGPYSYLLRPSDSHPGCYTLLLYDGHRVRKYRLELVTKCECYAVTTRTGPIHTSPAASRRNSVPITSASDSGQDSPEAMVANHVLDRQLSDDSAITVNAAFPELDPERPPSPSVPLPTCRTSTQVFYNQIPFPNVEAVVAAIETHLRSRLPSDTTELPTDRRLENGKGVEDDSPKKLPNGLPHLFKPVLRERKLISNPPSSALYMALRFKRQPSPCITVPEIHGELSLLTSRKKWKSFYAQLDRTQGILCLRDGDKRKMDRFDLSKCDFFPIHPLMFDRPYCFGLLLFGASSGDRDELVFSIDPPLAVCHSPSNMSSGRSSQGGLDPATYAGRVEEGLTTIQPYGPNSCTCVCCSSIDSTTCCPHQRPPCMKTVFSRWTRCVRMHCRNTQLDAANEEDDIRRQSCLRCYRTVEVKLTNAKLVPPLSGKLRRDDATYALSIDGIDIARAYTGSSAASFSFEDFPYGFTKLQLRVKEDKRKRQVALEVDLSNPNVESGKSDESSRFDPHGSPTRRKFSSAICDVRTRSCQQGTITYKELHVLPFESYTEFRKAFTGSIENELASLCVSAWKNLPNDVTTKPNFVCSLLLTATELKCHLRLIASLLRLDMPPDNLNDPFRGTTLGTQILDQYFNLICTEWRNQCFQRVRDEVANSPSSPHPQPSAYGARSSMPNTRLTPSCPPSRPYSLSAAPPGSPLPTDPPLASQTSLPASGPISNPLSSWSSTSEQDWYVHLLDVLIEDLIELVPQFPLQLRWIYSQLQSMQTDPQSNSIVRNLVILRGICPCLVSPQSGRGSLSGPSGSSSSCGAGLSDTGSTSSFVGSPSVGSQCSMSTGPACDRALLYVSKTLVALAGSNAATKAYSDHILTPQQFFTFHERLSKRFRVPITTPLNQSELKRLARLCEHESFQASCHPLSREWAQLASFFLEGLAPPGSLSTSVADTSPAGDPSPLVKALNDLELRTKLELKGAPTASVFL